MNSGDVMAGVVVDSGSVGGSRCIICRDIDVEDEEDDELWAERRA